MKNPALALLLLALGVPVALAGDDGDVPSTATGASLTKGYQTEAAAPAASPEPAEEEGAPPLERDGGSQEASTPRPSGPAAPRAASAASGGVAAAASEAGISCEQSNPPLKHVIREELPNLLRDTNKIHWWALSPNEAISYKFTAQKSGWGGFMTEQGTNARPTPAMITVSETPCDFDVAKAVGNMQVGPNEPKPKFVPCYDYNVGAGETITIMPIGQALAPGRPSAHICWIKPGKTYYFNIRSFVAKPSRDQCAEDAKTMGAGLKCGGIWQFIGAESPAEKK